MFQFSLFPQFLALSHLSIPLKFLSHFLFSYSRFLFYFSRYLSPVSCLQFYFPHCLWFLSPACISLHSSLPPFVFCLSNSASFSCPNIYWCLHIFLTDWYTCLLLKFRSLQHRCCHLLFNYSKTLSSGQDSGRVRDLSREHRQACLGWCWQHHTRNWKCFVQVPSCCFKQTALFDLYLHYVSIKTSCQRSHVMSYAAYEKKKQS